MTLTEQEMREIDDLARKLPKWQEHLADFRKRHPEMSPQEVMKKAGFTFRMKKGKLVQTYVKGQIQKILERMSAEDGEDHAEEKTEGEVQP